LLGQVAELPELKNVLVVLAGEGNVEIPINLNVRSMGGISDRTKRAMFFNAADVFVSTSLMETYGLTLIEAMSCGIPVVAFRTGGIPEAVPNEGGILCEVLNAAELKGVIQKLRNSKNLRNDLGNAARKLVAARNNKPRFAAAFAGLYEACLHRGQTSLIEPSALVT
jgi:glycosyltransferase involved in cell wall biosynthesis